MSFGLAALRAPSWLERWRMARTPRERRVIALLVLFVAGVIGWLALWQPLQRDLADLRAAVPANRGALAQARTMAGELAALARTAPARRPADPRAELERVLGERGLRAAVIQLDWQDDRARVVFAAVRFDTLIVALEALQRDAHLRAAEATVTARVEPGMVRAEFTLAR